MMMKENDIVQVSAMMLVLMTLIIEALTSIFDTNRQWHKMVATHTACLIHQLPHTAANTKVRVVCHLLIFSQC